MLPNALAIGVPYETFWHLTPKKLKAFYKAYEIKEKNEDRKMWYMGQYVLSAVSVAVEHNLAGKNAKSKYIQEPFLSKGELKEKEVTDKDIQMAILTEQRYMAMAVNKGLPETIIK